MNYNIYITMDFNLSLHVASLMNILSEKIYCVNSLYDITKFHIMRILEFYLTITLWILLRFPDFKFSLI